MSAYEALERLAAGLVEKSGGSLSPEQAMVRVLKTAEGRRLYELDRADQAAAIASAGLDPYAAPPDGRARVAKAISAEESIDELARRYQAAHPDMTLEQCVAHVLRTPEGRDLYAAHRNARGGEPVAGARSGSADASGGRSGSSSATGGLEGRGAGGPRAGRGATAEVRKEWTPDQRAFLEQLTAPFGEHVAKADDPVDALLDELGL